MPTFVYRVATVLSVAMLAFLAAISPALPDTLTFGFCVLALLCVLMTLPGDRARVLFILLTGFVIVRYVSWRVMSFDFSYGLVNSIGSCLLFGAELYTVVVALLGFFVNISPLERESVPLPADPDALPSVDVLIPTYSEPLSVVAPTVLGALSMEYPKHLFKVYVLDDGFPRSLTAKDPEVAKELRERAQALRELCERHGAIYLTREVNEHAKSGNLNAAMKHTNGELVAILDADHIPTTDFLKNTVGFFLENMKVALVQTPHFFVNADPVEKNLRLFGKMPAENDMFFRVVQKGLDLWNGSFFCGSAAVLRRSALDEVGGFSTDSITEDASTALKLHQRGWQSTYYGRPMVAGLQPETFSGFLVQRIRWATGMVQILIKQNPLLIKGLSLSQRLSYFSMGWFWFFPFARTIFFAAPLLSVFFKMHLYPSGADSFLGYTFP